MEPDASVGDGPNRRRLYRLPWSLHDNPVGWVEITDQCNISCKGCYRTALAGHKPLDDVKSEVLFLERYRNINNVHLAGGEPLIHPDVVPIVSFIRERGLNPVIITNGQRLTRDLLADLKAAGLVEMSFHVDSGQTRPGWGDADETALNELRQRYADVLWNLGGVNCNFNMTVNPRTLHRVPEVIRWALGNKGKVNGLTFITLRGFPTKGVTFVGDGRMIDLKADSVGMVNDVEDEMSELRSADLRRVIEDGFPHYEPAAFLGGTRTPDSVKWLIANAVCSEADWVGSVSPRTVELVQTLYHLRRGRYYAGGRGNLGRRVLLMAAVDGRVRGALRRLLKSPSRLLGKIYTLTVSVIEPNTLLPDGEYEMCDSCPDMTYHEGRLVHSCRLDEYRLYGALAKPVIAPKATETVD